MPTTNDETPTKKTLREKTQAFRDKARRLIRMEKINQILQRIFGVNKDISNFEKSIEDLTEEKTNAEKIVARAEYKIIKLDQDDPDYKEKKEKALKFVETEKKRQEDTLKYIDTETEKTNKHIETCKENIEKLDKEIEAVETGETRVSIDEVNSLASSLISKS